MDAERLVRVQRSPRGLWILGDQFEVAERGDQSRSANATRNGTHAAPPTSAATSPVSAYTPVPRMSPTMNSSSSPGPITRLSSRLLDSDGHRRLGPHRLLNRSGCQIRRSTSNSGGLGASTGGLPSVRRRAQRTHCAHRVHTINASSRSTRAPARPQRSIASTTRAHRFAAAESAAARRAARLAARRRCSISYREISCFADLAARGSSPSSSSTSTSTVASTPRRRRDSTPTRSRSRCASSSYRRARPPGPTSRRVTRSSTSSTPAADRLDARRRGDGPRRSPLRTASRRQRSPARTAGVLPWG